MVVLRRVEFLERHYFRDDRVMEILLRRNLRLLGLELLLFVVIQNDGAIGRAHIRALAVQRRGVVRLPENVEQLRVGNFR